MASIINTNSLSLLTQNNLSKSQGSLNTAIQRLSSGLRINSAKDDAAGQAIANRFTSNIKGLTQASRNANDGISLAQTTESALSEINTNLQRIRELAVQSSNGTNSAADKTSIQAEIKQRLDEIGRTTTQTDFNGTKILNSGTALKIQVGANDGETIDINLQKTDLASLGLSGFNVDGQGTVANAAATKDSVVLAGGVSVAVAPNGVEQFQVTVNNVRATSTQVFDKITDKSTVTSSGATANGLGTPATGGLYTFNATKNAFTFDAAAVSEANAATFLTPPAGGSNSAVVTLGGESQAVKIDSTGNFTAADDGAQLFIETATGNLSKTNGGTGTETATATNVTAALAADTVVTDKIVINGTTLKANATAATIDVVGATISSAALKTTVDATNASYDVKINNTPNEANTSFAAIISITSGKATGDNGYIDDKGAINATETTVTDFYVQTNGKVTDSAANQVFVDAAKKLTIDATTAGSATTDPLAVLDKALSKIDAFRGDLGAVQNRFDSVISSLGNTITNLASSRSRIEDADYAVEASNLTRANILQQAGTSVLAQANQSTQGVLSLLR